MQAAACCTPAPPRTGTRDRSLRLPAPRAATPPVQTLARRVDEALAEGLAEGDAGAVLAAALADSGARSPTPGERQHPAVAAAVAPAAAAPVAAAAVEPRARSQSQPAELPPAAVGGGGGEAGAALLRASSQPSRLQPPPPQQQPAGGSQQAATQQQQEQQQPADVAVAVWQAVLVPLAAVARVDVRPRVADAAAAVLLQIFKQHGEGLAPQQWLALFQSVLLPLLALPADGAAASARLGGAHPALHRPASTPKAAGIAAAAAAGGSPGSPAGASAPRRRSSLSEAAAGGAAAGRSAGAAPPGVVGAEGLPGEVPAALSFEGLDRCASGVA